MQRELGLAKGKGRLKSMKVRVIIMYYTHELIFQRTSLVKV